MKTVLVLIPSLFALLSGVAAHAGEPAGDVLLAVGKVWVESGSQRIALVRGQQVEVGQKLVTREGGHVHVRMKDGGLVALRPNSELEIQVFDYDPANPGAGKVRYSLRQGVARSVTGAIGEANKEAFRFNTPVAAIGVRGTDFVTFADPETTRVSVKSGAVVVAALSDVCKAEGFGACLEHAVALRAGDDRSYIEVTQQDKTPRLLQGRQLQLIDHVSPPLSSEPVAVLHENRVADVNDIAKEMQASKPDIPVTGPLVPETGANDVYWGRWKEVLPGVSGMTAAELLEAGKKIHVATPLFGLGVTQATELLPARWQADFKLSGGDAYVVANGTYSPAALAGGTLSINMATREFASQANVMEGLNTHNVAAAGQVSWQGYLLSDPARSNSTLYGIVHSNLDTVGSVFAKNLDDGRSLAGALIWHR